VVCPSGLRSTPRKRVRVQALRGFKSRRHRQLVHTPVWANSFISRVRVACRPPLPPGTGRPWPASLPSPCVEAHMSARRVRYHTWTWQGAPSRRDRCPAGAAVRTTADPGHESTDPGHESTDLGHESAEPDGIPGGPETRGPSRTRQSSLILAAFRPWGGSRGAATRGAAATVPGIPGEAITGRSVSLPTEDSPRGLGRTLGKRVGIKPSRVRISYPPRLVEQ
jgi:hypothetical protein